MRKRERIPPFVEKMRYTFIAVLLAVLALKLASLLPAEAAGRSDGGMAPILALRSARPIAAAHAGAMVRDANQARTASSDLNSASAQVVVSGQVTSVRLLVLDDAGELVQIWSNSDEPARLEARRGSRTGRAVPLSDALLAAYDRVAPTIGPGAKGLVFQRSETE